MNDLADARPVKSDSPSNPRASAMVFTRDRDSEGVIRQCLSDLPVLSAEFSSGNVDSAIARLAQGPSPRLLIVDLTGASDPVAAINNLSEVCEPGTGVIAIGEVNDIRLYRSLKASGIVEYFFKPLVTTLVTRSANAILTGSTVERATSTGKLIFVLSVRGGVGATTLAVASAWHLAEKRQRRVMLVDLDLQSGDAALQLDAVPSHALCEALEHPERVDELFLERATIHVTERLSLLASLEPLDKYFVPEEQAVLSLLANVARRYRYVFVDIPSLQAAKLLSVLHLPSVCLLVSNASLVAAREVARWREVIGSNNSERQTLHILNKSGANASIPDAEFARVAGQEPDIRIPYDREIAIASNLGAKGAQECAALQRGLAPILSHIAGEPVQSHHSLVRRLLGRS
jgi:pilus assembly protein CpaE